jgi:hypothetical protein
VINTNSYCFKNVKKSVVLGTRVNRWVDEHERSYCSKNSSRRRSLNMRGQLLLKERKWDVVI